MEGTGDGRDGGLEAGGADDRADLARRRDGTRGGAAKDVPGVWVLEGETDGREKMGCDIHDG